MTHSKEPRATFHPWRYLGGVYQGSPHNNKPPQKKPTCGVGQAGRQRRRDFQQWRPRLTAGRIPYRHQPQPQPVLQQLRLAAVGVQRFAQQRQQQRVRCGALTTQHVDQQRQAAQHLTRRVDTRAQQQDTTLKLITSSLRAGRAVHLDSGR